MKYVKEYAYLIVLGMVVGAANWYPWTWQFWVAIIPTIALIEWRAS